VKELQVVVLCGGLATRMYPHTLTQPKSLLEVAGRPFIDWQLDALRKAGVSEVVLCIGHLGQLIREHVGDGVRSGLPVRYSEDADPPRGTGGALRLAHERGLLAERFIAQYGDSYLTLDYAALLAARGEVVMSVFENDGRWDASNCVVEDDRVLLYEKGTQRADARWIDYGAVALPRAVCAELPADLAERLGVLAAAGRVRAHVVRDRFYEIGSPRGLAELDHLLRRRASSRQESL
jgi:NDP-sugar pyrophosphorylase family protein